MTDQTRTHAGTTNGHPPVDDSIPSDAHGGYVDRERDRVMPTPMRTPMRTPSPDDVVNAIAAFLGIGEHPDGSNCNAITDWFGIGCVYWCAEAVSRACVDAGFGDAHGNWAMPGIQPTHDRGFCSVPAMHAAFAAVGRYDQIPQRGDIVICTDDEHTCILESVNGDGTFTTIEGNFGNDVQRNARTMASIDGFCHPPYGSDECTWPGEYLRLGSTGPNVRRIQQWLDALGWSLVVDGDFGPRTDQAVRAFQGSRGLEVDGVVGPRTWVAACRR